MRATKDIDIVPSPAADNLRRLAKVLRELDAVYDRTGDFDPSEFPFDPLNPNDLAEGGNFVLSTRFGRLDVMQWVPGISGDLAFEHLAPAAGVAEMFGMTVRLCSREDLITMKRAAGRPQDVIDLERLGAA